MKNCSIYIIIIVFLQPNITNIMIVVNTQLQSFQARITTTIKSQPLSLEQLFESIMFGISKKFNTNADSKHWSDDKCDKYKVVLLLKNYLNCQ